MGFLKNILGLKDQPIRSYDDFWTWFLKNEKTFHKVISTHNREKIEKDFFNKLAPKLDELKEGLWYLTGMYDTNTVELIIAADGVIKNIVFAEELVAAAPPVDGWKFTALKPALGIKYVSIEMRGYKFDGANLNFYPNEDSDHPDEIDITVVHDSLTEENRDAITNGIYIFLDNYLGELDFAVNVDSLTIASRDQAGKELIPIGKLKDYLNWRQKEFVEKYDDIRYNTTNDNHSILEAELESGKGLVAVINTDLLKWDNKVSHPWIVTVEIPYDGSNNNGMPDNKTYELLNEAEENILQELKDADGYLNIGRQTADGEREIYFACREFRKPSKVLHANQAQYQGRLEISYEIRKDKYWQSFYRFDPAP